MKVIKNILFTILVFVLVKSCFYVKNSIDSAETQESLFNEEIVDSDAYVGSNVVEVTTAEEVHVGTIGDRQGFRRHSLDYGVSVEIPEDWYILPRQQVVTIRAKADKTYHGGDSAKETPLAANSSPDPQRNEALVRISFLTNEFEEADLQRASAADMHAVCEDFYNAWFTSPQNPKLIGRPICSTTTLNGKSALLTRYKRNGPNSDAIWTVNLMQVPLKEKTAMITISKLDGSIYADLIVTDISASIRFD